MAVISRAVKRMSRAVEDTALLQTPIPLGKDGVQSVIDFWTDATHEVKNLLANECDIIFQCRYIKNFQKILLSMVVFCSFFFIFFFPVYLSHLFGMGLKR